MGLDRRSVEQARHCQLWTACGALQASNSKAVRDEQKILTDLDYLYYAMRTAICTVNTFILKGPKKGSSVITTAYTLPATLSEILQKLVV